ncbi:MAG: DEAD/DEAH box helicase [Bacilli bacterium]|nr:DEAD/DEAH box helicase [Bacilli bacterium]MBN2876330.1 DEAD/DEAH box helicase [Bacilli bacterium]
MQYKNKKIEQSLTEMGFEEFTEIQTQTIPLIEAGKDIIGHSQTGTGKTAAFTLPMLERLDYNNSNIQAIIICPTRELAVQVKGEIDHIGKYLPNLKTVALYGGEIITKQIRSLKFKPQVVVGTPGRIIDHINRKLVRLENIDYLVLDEADEMLKMGFKEELETILDASNPNRQTVMFSATMPQAIVNITKKYMKEPELVSVVTGEETNKDITQYYYTIHEKNKVEGVARLLQVYNPKLTLIFCNTKRKVDDVTRELTKKGYNVNKIHGDLQQTTRMHVLDSFHEGVLDILVATDVAARGLDIKNVEAVINFDVPEKAEYYVHRIGRTGRIGNKGHSFTLVSKRELRRFDDVIAFAKSNIKKRNIPTPEKVIEVRKEQQIQEIEDIIENINISLHLDTADTLLQRNDPIHVVSALLHKMEKKDDSEIVAGDINEDFTKKQEKERRPSQEGKSRYHLNVGRDDGLSARELASVIMKSTGLKNSHISDISISNKSSFFSTDIQMFERVMRGMKNVTLSGKKTSIQMADNKPINKPRRNQNEFVSRKKYKRSR